MEDLSCHYSKVEKRWESLEERVSRKIAAYVELDRSIEQRMLSQAISASNMAKKIFWLRNAADAFTKVVRNEAACRKGCSHCCNISVVVSRQEAQVISRETGRKLNKSAGVGLEDIDNFNVENTRKMYGVPCIFLEDGECSIYNYRPLACRLQINMDDDDLLCRLVESVERSPRVPYLNHSEHLVVGMRILGSQPVFDDIRNWFG